MIMRMIRIGWLLNNVGFGHRTVKKMRKISHAIQNSFTNTRLSIGGLGGLHQINTQSNHLSARSGTIDSGHSGNASPRNNNDRPSPIIPHHQVQQSSGDQKSAGRSQEMSGDESTTPPSGIQFGGGPATPLPPSNGNTPVPIPTFGMTYSTGSGRSRAESDESVGRHMSRKNRHTFDGLHSMQDEQPKLFMVCKYIVCDLYLN